ncbi:MAG: MgtC/SapB family protein [Lachnospiraceae bacterium]|nr:MgtC/SapB family protein [Lachnospiraceae bacterium]
MWRWFLDTAASWTAAGIWIRLLFSLVVGLVIGIDRALKRRSAGVKTHVLVCMGSALVMLTSEYLMRTFPDAKADLTRMGAQVISGVGFLGVGTIMVTGRNQVRGLTTAACLWVCACVGLAAGAGFVEGTVYALILIVVTLKVLTKVDIMVHERANVFSFYLEFNANKSVVGFMDEMRQKNVRISSFDVTKNKIKGEGPSATMTVEVKDKELKKTLLHDIQAMEYVRYAEEL